jgi:hypothetical protein
MEITENAIPLSLERLQQILGTTIMYDDNLKAMLFLIALLTYTDTEQTNVFMTGETCAGKTYDVKEILWYFPKEDIIDYHGASPTSFFHSPDAVWVDGEYLLPLDMALKPSKDSDEAKKASWRELLSKSVLLRDLSRKIIVFYDMPHAKLLENLRGVLSHDKEVCYYSITDRQERCGFRTKRVAIKGFFTCIFCTASTFLDEQESSRNFLLTPETSEAKIKACLDLDSRRNTDVDFSFWHETDQDRNFLKGHVKILKMLGINKVMLDENLEKQLREWFEKQLTHGYKPKDNRDMPRLRALAKGFALLNWQTHKIASDPEPDEPLHLEPEDLNSEAEPMDFEKEPTEKPEKILWCTQTDVDVAIRLYSSIIKSNELGLSPEAYEVWTKVVQPILNDNGISIRDVHKMYFNVYKRQSNDRRLRDMLKLYPQKGLCIEQKDGRELRYFPISQEPKAEPKPITQTVQQKQLSN